MKDVYGNEMKDKHGRDIMDSFRDFFRLTMSVPDGEECYTCGGTENLKLKPQGPMIPSQHYICQKCQSEIENSVNEPSPPAYGDYEGTGWTDKQYRH